jgi:hypothetical protein
MLHSIFTSQLLSPTLDRIGQAYDKEERLVVFRSSLMETSRSSSRTEHPEGRKMCLLVPCSDSGHNVDDGSLDVAV